MGEWGLVLSSTINKAENEKAGMHLFQEEYSTKDHTVSESDVMWIICCGFNNPAEHL